MPLPSPCSPTLFLSINLTLSLATYPSPLCRPKSLSLSLSLCLPRSSSCGNHMAKVACLGTLRGQSPP